MACWESASRGGCVRPFTGVIVRRGNDEGFLDGRPLHGVSSQAVGVVHMAGVEIGTGEMDLPAVVGPDGESAARDINVDDRRSCAVVDAERSRVAAGDHAVAAGKG